MTRRGNADPTWTPRLVGTGPGPVAETSERPLITGAWWRSWAMPLAAVVIAFLIYYIWPNYISFDPADSGIAFRDGFAPHYAILMAHIVSGTLAIATLPLQVWPWLRKKHPAVHRISGQVYVFAGVIPTTLLIYGLLLLASQTNASTLGAVLLTTLWLTTTILGFTTGRRRRYTEHRRWMIRSFALGIAILWTRPAFDVAFSVPELASNLDMVQTVVGWAPWLLNLAIAEWWLYRTGRKRVVLRGLPSQYEPTARDAGPVPTSRIDDTRRAA
jgi:uncharacterized membrane protein